MANHRERVASVAEGRARVVALTPEKKVGDARYRPLYVRTEDAATIARFVSIADELASDISAMLDALVLQSRIIADQAATIERMRAEISAVRNIQVVAKSADIINEKLLDAAREGIQIADFECSLDTSSSSLAHDRATTANTEHDVAANTGHTSKAASLGELVELLHGAHLRGESAKERLAEVHQIINATRETNVQHSQSAKLHLKIGRLDSKAATGANGPEE